MSASQVTFCVYCGEEIIDGKSKTTCDSCDSIRKTKSEMSAAEERPRCPWCDSAEAKPILYGAPSALMWQVCSSLGAVWGGCLVDGREPQWNCGSCHRNWGAPKETASRYCNLCGRPSGQFRCASCCGRNRAESAQLLAKALVSFNRQEAERERFGAALMLFVMLEMNQTK